MSDSEGFAAPESGSNDNNILAFEQFTDDPEIAALLDFQPVPRRFKKERGWTPDMQRLFIAKLAVHGSPGKACNELGMFRSGVDKLCIAQGSESFREAWTAAVALAERRRMEFVASGQASTVGVRMPFVDNRRKPEGLDAAEAGPEPGQVLNERGEWEDQESMKRRAEDAGDSICGKLLRCRRMFLMEICDSPGKRAAFEILTELPIDWERAARGEAQPDEPWHRPRARDADMVLTAESGWMMGERGYGPDKKAEIRKAIDEWRAAEGLEPVEWNGE